MKLEEIQLATNETIVKLINATNDKYLKMQRLTIIIVVAMLLQTMTIVGGILYFFNAYSVTVDDTYLEQSIEGDNTSINNIQGENNSIENNYNKGVDENGESNTDKEN